MQLSPSGPPQEVVTYTSQQQSSPGFTYRGLVILSWDHFAHRWVSVFDSSKAQVPSATAQPAGDNSVLPLKANISSLDDVSITPKLHRTDLVFWGLINYGANGNLEVGIVHYDGQSTSVDYFNSYPPAQQGTPEVTGRAPSQQLRIPAGWLTISDPQCCAVRSFIDTIGLKTQTYSGGFKSSTYVVTASTQSWLGVYAVLPPNLTGGPTPPDPIVASVVQGGPAAGVLQPGDQLVGVSGETAPASSTLGPPVIDEVATNLPGKSIPLSILRSGNQMVVNITLGSTASPALVASTMPSVGYLGVRAVTEASSAGAPAGVLVSQVEGGSPAESAGLVAGDLITSVGATQVSSAQAFAGALYLLQPGTPVQIAYVDAGGAAHTLSVTLGSYPADSPGPRVARM